MADRRLGAGDAGRQHKGKAASARVLHNLGQVIHAPFAPA